MEAQGPITIKSGGIKIKEGLWEAAAYCGWLCQVEKGPELEVEVMPLAFGSLDSGRLCDVPMTEMRYASYVLGVPSTLGHVLQAQISF
jgi:hypothetical protein